MKKFKITAPAVLLLLTLARGGCERVAAAAADADAAETRETAQTQESAEDYRARVAALENELCREALGAHIYTTASTEYHPDGIQISNWFLRRIEVVELGLTKI